MNNRYVLVFIDGYYDDIVINKASLPFKTIWTNLKGIMLIK